MSKIDINDYVPRFVEAVLAGDLQTVDALIDKFPRLLKIRDKSGRNLLMMAAYKGDPHMMNYLVAFHVMQSDTLDIEAEDSEGLTAFDWAVLGGSEFAQSLLTKAANSDDWT